MKSPARPTLFAAALLLALLAASALPSEAITLTLLPTVRVKQATLTVADVATSDSPMPAPIAALSLGATPNLAEHAAITQDQITAAIMTSRPDLGPVTWNGADQCIVERAARSVSPDSLAGAILPELQNATDNKGEVKIEEFASMPPVLVPDGQVGAQIELPTTALLHPWVVANVIYYVDGERVAVAPIRFRWSWTRQVWQATRNLNMGEEYNPADFRLTGIDAIKADGAYLSELPEAGDVMIGRRINAGAVVVDADLVPKKIVQRGETVTVNYVQSNFRVSMKGVALQDGSKGQIISVQNTTSQRDLFAKVIDATTLEIVQ